MPWSSQAVVAQQVIIEGPTDGTFTYDASGNLRSADVGQITTDPLQGLTCQQGISTFNGHGATISLNATALDAQLLYADTGSSTQGQLIASDASSGGTDPFGNAFVSGKAVYLQISGGTFLATQLQTGFGGTTGLFFLTAATAAGPYSASGSITDSSSNVIVLTPGAGGHVTVSSSLVFGSNPVATLDTDLAGYPTLTDNNGLTLNNSGCQPASGNKLSVTTTTFGSLGFGTIPANNAEANAVYEFECGGYGMQAAAAAVVLTLQARFGASPGAATDVVGTAYAPLIGNAGDTFQWSARVRAQCLTSGAAATWRIYVTGIITDTVTGASFPFAVGTGPTDVTQDSTAAINMGLSAKWASVVNAPTITKSGHQPGRRG